MDVITSVLSGDTHSLEETARLILSTATSSSSSVSVNYLIPLLLLASQCSGGTEIFQADQIIISVPVGYFFFRLGLFNLDDTLGMTSGIDLSGYNAPSAGYGAPAPSYNAPAPAPSYNSPSPSYNSNSPSSGLVIPNSGAYLTTKEDDQVGCEEA